MSKLPMENKPIRLGAGIADVVETLLHPLSGKKLEVAQKAVLQVYHSGLQMQHAEWVTAYESAVKTALQEFASTT